MANIQDLLPPVARATANDAIERRYVELIRDLPEVIAVFSGAEPTCLYLWTIHDETKKSFSTSKRIARIETLCLSRGIRVGFRVVDCLGRDLEQLCPYGAREIYRRDLACSHGDCETSTQRS